MQYIIALVILLFTIHFFNEASAGTIALVLGGIGLFLLVCFNAADKEDKRIMKVNKDNEQKQRDYIKRKALEYKEALAKKRTQLITKDDYGDIDDSKWKAEIVTFFNNKIGSIPEELALITEEKIISAEELARIIDDVAREGQSNHKKLFSFSEEMDGIEYEYFCASLLRDVGWETVVSQASNDQGADIVIPPFLTALLSRGLSCLS